MTLNRIIKTFFVHFLLKIESGFERKATKRLSTGYLKKMKHFKFEKMKQRKRGCSKQIFNVPEIKQELIFIAVISGSVLSM